MSDIRLVWDQSRQVADWQIVNGDIATGRDLETAAILSLFTDAPAQEHFRFADDSRDRAGWWGNTFEPYALGSRLRQLKRMKKSGASNVLATARDIVRESLTWLVTEHVVESLDVKTAWSRGSTTGIDIEITATEPVTYRKNTITYKWAWDNLATAIGSRLDQDFRLDQSRLS